MAKVHSAKIVAMAVVVLAVGAVCAAGCSPQSSDQTASSNSQGSDASQAATQATWSLDTECTMCHDTESGTMKDGASGASAHVQQAQATCATCHTDEQGLASVHKGKTASDAMPKQLKKTAVEAQTCQASGCHDKTADEMVALTASYTGLVDTKGTQVNPHEVMGLTAGHADITCSNCHNMHEAEVAAADTCVACHHAGVYECNTCH